MVDFCVNTAGSNLVLHACFVKIFQNQGSLQLQFCKFEYKWVLDYQIGRKGKAAPDDRRSVNPFDWKKWMMLVDGTVRVLEVPFVCPSGSKATIGVLRIPLVNRRFVFLVVCRHVKTFPLSFPLEYNDVFRRPGKNSRSRKERHECSVITGIAVGTTLPLALKTFLPSYSHDIME